MTSESQNQSKPGNASSPMLVAGAWLFVGIPLAWGVFQTAYHSLPLFGVNVGTTPAAASSQAATAPSTQP